MRISNLFLFFEMISAVYFKYLPECTGKETKVEGCLRLSNEQGQWGFPYMYDTCIYLFQVVYH